MTPMLRRRSLAPLLLAACAAQPTRAADGGHPRLMMTPAVLREAQARLSADAAGRTIRAAVIAEAEGLLPQPPVPRQFEARRPVLLPAMRAVLRRVQALGVACGLTGDARFARRGADEVLALCAYPDWNPQHFLDVAEAGHAAAVGLDWFHAAMTPAERAAVTDALVAKVLRPAEAEYAARRGWTRARHNWNLVCNGGVAVAALAVRETAPELAGKVLDRALASARSGFSAFGQDGGWAEGPSYWEYATAYAVYLLAALETAGVAPPPALVSQPGFGVTGGFMAHMTGPSGRVFNFADGGPGVRRAPQLLWLARRFGRPQDAWTELRRMDRPVAFDALWYPGPASPPTELDAAFPDAGVASFRGAWSADATWLAIKGGDNGANHSHLDLGSFVLEAGGQRFAAELGADDYALPGYFSRNQRHDYVRTASRGQNVLLRGEGEDQRHDATAPLLGFRSDPGFARTVIGLDGAYPGLAHRRGAALVDRRHALLVDEVRPAAPTQLSWQMFTEAAISPAGRSAVLERNGVRLRARLLDAADGAVFQEADAWAPPPNDPNRGFRRLVVRVPPQAGPTRIAVLFSPDDGTPPNLARASAPLDTWL